MFSIRCFCKVSSLLNIKIKDNKNEFSKVKFCTLLAAYSCIECGLVYKKLLKKQNFLHIRVI